MTNDKTTNQNFKNRVPKFTRKLELVWILKPDYLLNTIWTLKEATPLIRDLTCKHTFTPTHPSNTQFSSLGQS